MELTNHWCFPQPDDLDQKVWRYLSIEKFLDFYMSGCLYFSRVDLLDDKHEGTYTKLNTIRFPGDEVQIPSGKTFTQEEYTNRSREGHHVNCWRLDKHESEAMWKIYCPAKEGLAIQSNYKKLVESLPTNSRLFIGQVNYLDYETEEFNVYNGFTPIMHKRIAYAHEKEVRIVHSVPNYMNDHNLLKPDPGIKFKTTLLENIEAIYTNPHAEKWYYETIKELFEKLGINIALQGSSLDKQIYF